MPSKYMRNALREKAVLSNSLITVGETPEKGRGLYARQRLRAGDDICVFEGQLLPRDNTKLRQDDYGFNFGHAWDCDPDPATIGGHLANHSCAPNAHMHRPTLVASSHARMVLTALMPIALGEEITIYYASKFGHDRPCLCGSTHCAGTIGLLPPSFWRAEMTPEGMDRLKHHAFVGIKNRNPGAVGLVMHTLTEIRYSWGNAVMDDVRTLAIFSSIPNIDAADRQWLRDYPQAHNANVLRELPSINAFYAQLASL